MFVKVIGSFLVITCGILFGISEKEKFARKIHILKGIIRSLDLIHSEISCIRTPTEELLDKLCLIENKTLSKFFADCKNAHIKRRDLPFSIIWSRALKDASYLELKENEINSLSEVGIALGRYEADEQLRTILHTRKSFEAYLQSAEEAARKNGKLYGNLSIISGIALVIILL